MPPNAITMKVQLDTKGVRALVIALKALKFYGEYPEGEWHKIDADRGAVARKALKEIKKLTKKTSRRKR